MRAAPSLTVGYTGNARTNRSKSSQTWAALTLTAVQGVQHSKGTSAAIALKQASFNLGGGSSTGKRRPKRRRSSYQNRQHLPWVQCRGYHNKGSPNTPMLIAPKQAAFNLGVAYGVAQ